MAFVGYFTTNSRFRLVLCHQTTAMLRISSLVIAAFFCLPLLIAQSYSEYGPENNFRSPQNPHYWKNKMPFPGYWQQDVHYRIDARIDEKTDIIRGTERLTYWNNSPDTLSFVYFHLYQNAFIPGSYLDDLQCHNHQPVNYGRYEKNGLGTTVDSIRSEGVLLKTELDNTILKVWLPKPLLPGTSTDISLSFTSFYDAGSTRRRMKRYNAWGFKHYNGCQWYPKICVYDRKSGWNTDQHLNREFYGDFGTFDVNLTFASNYIVEATGVLQNEQEVLPDELKKKLDLRLFRDKPWDSAPSEIIPYKPGETKTWRYHAENVHDFAFTADPTYRIQDTVIYPGGQPVHCIAICQEPHASGWQDAAPYLARIIELFSRDFGVYNYPKIIVADAQDGMEYPMITLDGGRSPEYKGLLVHEVAHNWFYGMIGNNETYRAFMDEGFTQFLTVWGMEALDGDTVPYSPIRDRYVKRFYEPPSVRDSRAYLGYLNDAVRNIDESINQHSDGFNGALGQGGGYRQVYAKTATMLYNLQYVLGDRLFSEAMKYYVQQWKFAHPYPEDFRNSMTQFTKQDLNWFFDQWMETTKKIDYAVKRVRKLRKNQGYEISFLRKGRMQMPIDFRIIDKKGATHDFHIPNTWFVKELPAETQVRKKWYGWDKLQPIYKDTIQIPGKIRDVIIDPSERLADVYMLDNQKRQRPELRFDSRIFPTMSWKKYRLWIRPDLWYNELDGFKVGVHLHGNYMRVLHQFQLSMWVNTHLAQGIGEKNRIKEYKRAAWFSYDFSGSHSLSSIIPGTTFYFQSRLLDGLELYRPGFTVQLPKNITLDIHFQHMNRPQSTWNEYLIYPGEWGMPDGAGNGKRYNVQNTLNLSMRYDYTHKNISGFFNVRLRSSAWMSRFDYHYLELEHVDHIRLWKLDLHTRTFGRLATGERPAPESQLFLAGANPEQMMENKYVRAAGWVPYEWIGGFGNRTNHFHHAGGLNLRGYAGYLAPELDNNGVLQYTYRGESGAAFNVELDVNRIVPVRNRFLREYFTLNTYLFADGGSLTYRNSSGRQQFARFRMDAGAGVAFTVKKFGPLQGIRPLTFRFDVPFFINQAPAGTRNLDFRFVMGITRLF